MAASKQPKAKVPSSTNKENHSQKGCLRTISVSGLFAPKQTQRKHSVSEVRDILAPRPAGITKPTTINARFSSRLGSSKKAENHPFFRSFAENVDGYRKGVTKSIEQQLEPVCKSLLARVDGLTIRGQPLHVTEGSLDVSVEDSVARGIDLLRPLGEETVKVQRQRKDGTSRAVDAKLGTLIQDFEALLEQTQVKVKTLRKKVHEIDLEMSTVYQDILDTERDEVKKARHELDLDLEALAKEAHEAKEQTLLEFKQAREEERTTGEEERRKMNALLAA